MRKEGSLGLKKLGRQAVHYQIQQAHCFVLPSTTRSLSFGASSSGETKSLNVKPSSSPVNLRLDVMASEGGREFETAVANERTGVGKHDIYDDQLQVRRPRADSRYMKLEAVDGSWP